MVVADFALTMHSRIYRLMDDTFSAGMELR